MQNLFGSEETQVAEWDIDREEKAPNKGHSISQITYHSGRLMHHSAGIFCELVQNMCFIVLLAEGWEAGYLLVPSVTAEGCSVCMQTHTCKFPCTSGLLWTCTWAEKARATKKAFRRSTLEAGSWSWTSPVHSKAHRDLEQTPQYQGSRS